MQRRQFARPRRSSILGTRPAALELLTHVRRDHHAGDTAQGAGLVSFCLVSVPLESSRHGSVLTDLPSMRKDFAFKTDLACPNDT